MSELHEGHKSAIEHIRSKKTLAEILEVATSFEKAAYDFYLALIPKVSKNIRFLVEELAAEEQTHYELFSSLARNPDIEAELGQTVQTPVEDHCFSDYIQVPDMGDNPDDQRILQYALGREDAAMKHYRELATSTAPGPVHDLFEYLATEETRHKLELEKLYYQIVFGGTGAPVT